MRSGYFKERYGELIVLTDSPAVKAWTGVLLVALVAAPMLLGSYLLSHMTIILFTLVGVLGLTVLTGHEAPGKRTSRVQWQHVATAGNTIVLLMGVTQLRANLSALLEAGLDPETPAAAIRWGSTPRQRVVRGTAATLASEVEAGRRRPPVTVGVGA